MRYTTKSELHMENNTHDPTCTITKVTIRLKAHWKDGKTAASKLSTKLKSARRDSCFMGIMKTSITNPKCKNLVH